MLMKDNLLSFIEKEINEKCYESCWLIMTHSSIIMCTYTKLKLTVITDHCQYCRYI